MFKFNSDRKTIGLSVAVPYETFIACRTILFAHGISLQELVSQIVSLVENKDPRIMSILESSKKNKFAGKKQEYVFTNSKAIYGFLEENSPLKDKSDDSKE